MLQSATHEQGAQHNIVCGRVIVWLSAALQWMEGVILVITGYYQNDDENSFQFFLNTEKNTDRRKNHEKTWSPPDSTSTKYIKFISIQ